MSLPSYNTENSADLGQPVKLGSGLSAPEKAPVAKKGEDPEKLKARLAKEKAEKIAKAKKAAEAQAKM